MVRHVELEILTREETHTALGAESQLLRGRGDELTPFEHEPHRPAQCEGERDQVADEQRALLSEGEQAGHGEGPPREQTDDDGHHELLPTPRRKSERLREHEGPEEEERRLQHGELQGCHDVEGDIELHGLDCLPHHGGGDRDDQEHQHDADLLGAPQHQETEHRDRDREHGRAHPPRRRGSQPLEGPERPEDRDDRRAERGRVEDVTAPPGDQILRHARDGTGDREADECTRLDAGAEHEQQDEGGHDRGFDAPGQPQDALRDSVDDRDDEREHEEGRHELERGRRDDDAEQREHEGDDGEGDQREQDQTVHRQRAQHGQDPLTRSGE